MGGRKFIYLFINLNIKIIIYINIIMIHVSTNCYENNINIFVILC
jgi:hypothetical protein